ncbi:MAG: hypothetical protein ACK5KP_07335 [Paludibacteraceae bacterium]
MKKKALKLYDKLLIGFMTLIAGALGFNACNTQKNIDTQKKISDNKETEQVKKSDTIPVFKNPRFDDGKFKAMYGVRQDSYKE